MRNITGFGCVVALMVAVASPAQAIGCLSGGAMGAIAGHQVHHGVVGAVGGCVAGHYANKRAKARAAQAKADADARANGQYVQPQGMSQQAPAP